MTRPEITHADLVTLTAWMAENGSTPHEIAYAVEKPWKHLDLLAEATGQQGLS